MNYETKNDRTVGTGDRSSKKYSFNPNSTRNNQFQYSGRNKPCPICGRTKDQDCRWNEEVAFCHTYAGQDAYIPGYVYRGREDIWGLYFPNKNQAQKAARPQEIREFIYRDTSGNSLVKVTRKDNGSGKKQIFQSHWNENCWVQGLTKEVKPSIRLYQINHPTNQQAIASNQPILIVEGEGKVDLLLGLGVAATSSIGGAGKWRKYGYPNYLEDLAGAKIVLCPDRDQPGLAHCLDIEQDFPDAQWIYAFPESPEWQKLPEKNGLDIADWVKDYNLGAEQIYAAIEPKRTLSANDSSTRTENLEGGTIAQCLLKIAEEATYFHTPDQKAYADTWIKGVRKTYPVRYRAFKLWLLHEVYTRYQRTVGSETLNQVLGILEARANFEGEEREVHLRIAEYGGKIYLDLGTKDWQVAEISPTGWQIVTDYPVRFRRPDALLPLPKPEKGSNLNELRQLLNLENEAWILVVSWLLFSLYPKFPHPILILCGEQGSGKTSVARMLKHLLDPGKAPLIPQVANLRDLAIQANNRWILIYDNLSYLDAEQSDALCRISTGGGFSTRTLYENEEETIFEFLRPQILTGIDYLATRGDLLERSLIVNLPAITEDQRLPEAELERKFTEAKARILGALLTALSKTLAELPVTQATDLPRMADFARFAIAAETALELPSGTFLDVYRSNQQDAHITAVESSPVAVAIERLLEIQPKWEGTVTELLSELEQQVDERMRKSKAWFSSSRALGKMLSRLAPDLRGVGIEVTHNRSSSKRMIRIERVAYQTSQTSQTSQSKSAVTINNDISL